MAPRQVGASCDSRGTGDISASKRYYKDDIVEPEFLVNKDGTMDVPTKPGIGVEVNMKMLEKVTVRQSEYIN